MSEETRRIRRARSQTPEQEAEERAIREKFQRERPSLDQLIASGDVDFVSTMGEYCAWRNAVGKLKALRHEQGLSIEEVARKTGIDPDELREIENGPSAGLTFGVLTRYAHALGQQVTIDLAKAG